MITTLFLTAAILGALAAGSIRFNRYIESRPIRRRADGETALWVVIGCAYTVAGAVGIVFVWANQLGIPWSFGGVVFAAIIAAFIAAGLPMFWGDMHRTQAWRETNEYLERAERVNGNGNGK